MIKKHIFDFFIYIRKIIPLSMFKKKIFLLLVEDEDDIIKLIKGILKNTRVKLYVSKTGEDALDIIKTKNIDIALVDYRLPYKNGILITNEIKQIKDIPVILETGEKMLCENIDMSKEFQFDDVICKPFDKGIVLETLKKYIN
jgi:DNA-binding response OmpR family regulator